MAKRYKTCNKIDGTLKYFACVTCCNKLVSSRTYHQNQTRNNFNGIMTTIILQRYYFAIFLEKKIFLQYFRYVMKQQLFLSTSYRIMRIYASGHFECMDIASQTFFMNKKLCNFTLCVLLKTSLFSEFASLVSAIFH